MMRCFMYTKECFSNWKSSSDLSFILKKFIIVLWETAEAQGSINKGGAGWQAGVGKCGEIKSVCWPKL